MNISQFDARKLLAKEIKRVRALAELSEKCNGITFRGCFLKAEVKTLRRILAILLKESLTS